MVVAADQAGDAGVAPAPQVTRSFTVARAALQVTADAATRVFDQADPVFTGVLSGVVGGDAITATYVTSATRETPAGTYGPTSAEAITPVLADPSGRLANYTVTSGNGTLTITTATATITWPTPAAITYGTPLSGEQLQATTETAAQAAAQAAAQTATQAAGIAGAGSVLPAVSGTYVYTPPLGTILHAGADQLLSVTFTPADSVNYAPATSTVLLTVWPKALTLRAVDQAMVVGEAVPSLTVDAEGLVAPDTVAGLETPATVTTTATSTSPAGSYAIVVAGATDPDYVITAVDGVLVVSAPADSGTGATDCGCSSHPCGLGGGFAVLVFSGLLALAGGLRRRAVA